MWNLNLTRLECLIPRGLSLGDLAIETGTCRGNGTRALARIFSRVISIELSLALSSAAKEKLSGAEFSHVEFVTGDSGIELAQILGALPEQESIFIFLDAHWSGDRSVKWEKSEWKGYGIDTVHRASGAVAPSGQEQCPLADELQAIVDHWPGRAFVLIDDMKNIPQNGPGHKDLAFPGEDWSHLSRDLLRSIVQNRLEQIHELRDPEQWFLELGKLSSSRLLNSHRTEEIQNSVRSPSARMVDSLGRI